MRIMEMLLKPVIAQYRSVLFMANLLMYNILFSYITLFAGSGFSFSNFEHINIIIV